MRPWRPLPRRERSAPRDDLEAMQGTWRMTSYDMHARPMDSHAYKVRIKGDRWTFVNYDGSYHGRSADEVRQYCSGADLFINLSGGSGPDGMALADDGSLAVAHVGLGSVWIFSSLGEPRYRLVSCEDLSTTNVAFGGSERRQLYITESDTGSMLIAELDAPGSRCRAERCPRLAWLARHDSDRREGVDRLIALVVERPLDEDCPLRPGF